MAARMEFDHQEKKKKGKKYKSPFDSGHHAVYFGPPGTGKAQPLYSKVLTPSGFVDMKDIHVGSQVISGTNNIAQVLGVYPQGKKPIYEITLEDDSTCRCSDEHLWLVSVNDKNPQVMTLQQIMQYEITNVICVPKKVHDAQSWLSVIKIEYVGEEECQCIYVDDPSHLYVTDDYIITHNTTVARIMTGFLYKYGYIKNNKCVEVDGNFLKAGTETATKTTMVIRQAMGGVLFVDEAYALIQGDQYGQDAIATLIKQMEDYRGRFVLILAGYTNEMRELLNANPGFQSRLKEYLYFEEYNDQDMLTIFRTMASHKGYTVTSDAEQNVVLRIQAERRKTSFGNARTARSILEEAIEKHAYHYIKNHLPESQRYELHPEDISVTPRTI
jgi:DNA polymerase III delta prime subunit